MDLNDELETLEQTPTQLAALLQVDQARLLRRGAAGWSAKEYIGHICDGIEVWDERARLVMTQENPFLAAYDQDAYVLARNHQGSDLSAHLAARTAQRATTLEQLRQLPPEGWARVGTHAERGAITLREIVSIIAGHERTHLQDIEQLLAE